MTIKLTIPSHITRFEMDFKKDVSVLSLVSKPGGNHVRLERRLTNSKLYFDTTYLQQVVNEMAEGLR